MVNGFLIEFYCASPPPRKIKEKPKSDFISRFSLQSIDTDPSTLTGFPLPFIQPHSYSHRFHI